MDKNKNQISTCLMILGVIFIVIAGSVFITKAWGDMSYELKLGILAIISVVMLSTSVALSFKGFLKKTATALYYIGVAFAGFFATLLLIETTTLTQVSNGDEAIVLIVSIIVGALILFRFVFSRNVIEFATLYIIGYANAYTISALCGVEQEGFAAIMTVLFVGYAVVDGLFNKNILFKKSLYVCNLVFLINHIRLYVIMAFTYSPSVPSDESFVATIYCVGWIAVFAIMCVTRKEKLFSNVLITSIYLGTYIILNNVLNYTGVCTTDFEGSVIFTAYLINSIIVVALGNKALLVAHGIMGMAAPYIQLCDLSGELKPYTICFALTFVLCIFREMIVKKVAKNEELDLQEYLLKILAGGTQLVSGVLVMIASIVEDNMYNSIFWAVIAMTILFVTLICQEKESRKLGYTLTTAALVFSAFAIPKSGELEEFKLEINCLAILAGCFLLRIIWNNIKETIGLINYVITCVIMAILLINNYAHAELANMLILGITGAIILIVSAILGSKKYVIMSCITLGLMAIYMTRELLANIEWWVYLFIVGVILVGIAIKKELDSRK